MNKIVFRPVCMSTCGSPVNYSDSREKDESNEFPPVLIYQRFLCCLSSQYLKHTDMSEAEVANIMITGLAWNSRTLS